MVPVQSDTSPLDLMETVMKHKAIKFAVASALTLGVAASASAVVVNPWDVTGAEAYTLHLGGATAQDAGIIRLMQRLCDGDMVRVQGVSQSAIICAADGADSLPIAAGTRLVVYKNSASGSSSGVNPVAAGTALPFLNLASLPNQAAYLANCATSVQTTGQGSYTQYQCGTNISNANAIPDGGLSDVEPALLGWSAANGALDVFAGPQVLFGLPVSRNFRDALQGAQNLTVGSDNEANMPSLTKAQIASIFNGGIVPVIRLASANGVTLAAPSGSASISVCRRKAGSGTLASFNAYFLNAGCANGVVPMVSGVDGDAALPSVASRVNEYGSTGRVFGCLNANHEANRYAIGVASMENVPGSAYSGAVNPAIAPFDSDTGNWRWIKIQGYAPTLLNTVGTKYDFLYEATWQHRSSSNPAGTLTSQQKALFDRVVATHGSAPVIQELNLSFVQSFGASGLLGRPGTSTAPSAAPAGPLTQAEVVANPVNSWTRNANSCQPARVVNPNQTGLDMLL